MSSHGLSVGVQQKKWMHKENEFLYTVKHYVAIKRNKTKSFEGKDMVLTIVKLSQSEKKQTNTSFLSYLKPRCK